MNPFEMVIGIVLIVTIGSILRARYGLGGRSRRRSETFDPATAVDSGETRRLRDEVRTLKERVAVLERVITDDRGSRDLAHEIEALRSRDA